MQMLRMSAFGGKADIPDQLANVRLLTQSGRCDPIRPSSTIDQHEGVGRPAHFASIGVSEQDD